MSYSQDLDNINKQQDELNASKMILLDKALRSDSPEDVVKASKILNEMGKNTAPPTKAYFIDPLQFNANLGYKDKPYSLTYTTLLKMSKVPVINAIIKTRKNQIADFAEPQENRFSTGFIIRKKPKFGKEQKMTKQDEKTAEAITEFLMNGGNASNWNNDDFDTFIRKIVNDSLIYDQMTFECIRNRRGELETFKAVDASTFRIADSYFSEDYENEFFKRYGAVVWENNNEYGKKINGYYPSYVQVYQNIKVNDFYPWELCFGIRNPSANIHANGYGCSELEELINVVTSMLWSDEYNRRFFSQGSAPKGFLRVKGVNNEAALQQFRQQWQSMITGVMQAWKTPVVEADVDWIDMQKSNRDMEYNSWLEYLIKIACSIYAIDPTEIGWDIARSSGSTGMFESSQEQRLKHSKDKGLYPLLKFIQKKINKYIVSQLNPEFEFCFVGLNGLTIQEELDMDIKKGQSFMTINELREKYDLKPLEFGDIPSNSAYLQAKSQAQFAQQGAGGEGMMMGGDEEGGGYDNPFVGGGDEGDEDENPFEDFGEVVEEDETEKSERDKLVKAFDNFIKNNDNERI